MAPIDASLSLWGAGRKERITELEAELREEDAQQQRPQQQQQAKRGSNRESVPQRSTHVYDDHWTLQPQEINSGHGGENDRMDGGKESAIASKDGSVRSARTDQTQRSQAETRSQLPASANNDIRSNGDRCTAATHRRSIDTTAHDDGSSNSSSSATTSEGPSHARLKSPDSAAIEESKAPERSGNIGSRLGTEIARRVDSSASTLEERLILWDRGWRPPALRALPRGGQGFFSGWTYLGQPERFELVKSANRFVCTACAFVFFKG